MKVSSCSQLLSSVLALHQCWLWNIDMALFPFDFPLFLQCQHWQMHAVLSPCSCHHIHSYGLYLAVHSTSLQQRTDAAAAFVPSYTFFCMGCNKIPDKLSSPSLPVLSGCSVSSTCTLHGGKYSKSFYCFTRTLFTDQTKSLLLLCCGPRTVCP